MSFSPRFSLPPCSFHLPSPRTNPPTLVEPYLHHPQDTVLILLCPPPLPTPSLRLYPYSLSSSPSLSSSHSSSDQQSLTFSRSYQRTPAALLQRCLRLRYKEHTETRNRVGFDIFVSAKCRFGRILAVTASEKV